MIKQICLWTLLVFCSGCALWTPPRFDNNEYLVFAQLETHARFLVEECSDNTLAKKRIQLLLFESETLQTYSYYLPHSSELYVSSKIINKQIVEFKNRYNNEVPPSVVYCKIKTKTLIKELRRILTTAGQLEVVQ